MGKGKNITKKDDQALARALADYQNLVKRVERERFEVLARSNKSLVEKLLPILDNFQKAQGYLKDPGIEMALDEFYKVLESAGIEKIQTQKGDTFDAATHEAIEGVVGGQEGSIAEVLTDGYKWKDGTILRPAKVIVYNDRQSS